MSKRKWKKDEIDEYRKLKGAFFYYNKEDSNFLVQKAFGIGWTVNWANPISWVFVIIIVGVVLLRKYFM
ncbi:DUF5808 domain-containing protein [Neobacillus massiliamazoniensis]|uniref:DUF5808 domain-containing protein n=1 Tax=Neobacillus massiliamazoniensis TaxID=1499688 RepID=A0A0U1P301_9BACI|nr:DUF5808 domain-containing protein [Neobacillus massiliamazoniensis]CRK84694.1 hypothetical protein BN000_04740 [Neobacillus massiliamazoniensis]